MTPCRGDLKQLQSLPLCNSRDTQHSYTEGQEISASSLRPYGYYYNTFHFTWNIAGKKEKQQILRTDYSDSTSIIYLCGHYPSEGSGLSDLLLLFLLAMFWKGFVQTFSGWQSPNSTQSLHSSISIVLISQFTLEQWKNYCVNFRDSSTNLKRSVLEGTKF